MPAVRADCAKSSPADRLGLAFASSAYNAAVRAQAKVHARVAGQMQCAKNALRQLFEPRHGTLRQILRGRGGDAVFLLIAAVPFHLAGGDGGQVFRQRSEGHFPHRQYLQPLVADHPDIELAALDVLLDQRIGMRLLVNERDSLLELALIRDHGGLRNAERGILGRGFHEHRKAQALRNPRTPCRGRTP